MSKKKKRVREIGKADEMMWKKKRRVREIEIPGDVVEEILARLPAKSLLRFACVSKEWCSLFRNPTFISKHLINGSSGGSEHALLNLPRFQSFLNLRRFSKPDKFSLLESPPGLKDLVNLDNIKDLHVVGQFHGLICYMSGFKDTMDDPVTPDLVLHIWNPVIGQDKIVPKSNILSLPPPSYDRRDRFGFGHDPKSGDYKVVRFAFYDRMVDDCSEFLRVEAEVYSLRTDSWRPVGITVVFKGMPYYKSVAVCLGGLCYWMGDDFSDCVPMIISYDLSNEVFQQYLVRELVHPYPYPRHLHLRMMVKLFVWKGSLTLVMFPSPRPSRVRSIRSIDLWSFESGVDSPLTLKEHLEDMDMVVTTGECWNHVEFLWNDDLILTYRSDDYSGTRTTLKACHVSTRRIRNISSVEIGYCYHTLRIVGYTPSLVSPLT